MGRSPTVRYILPAFPIFLLKKTHGVTYRAELQRAFFPASYRNSEVTPKLNPGDKRVWTALHIFLELRDETTLHIPFREASKVIESSSFLTIQSLGFIAGLAMGWYV